MLDVYALTYLQNQPKILHESITHRYHLYLLPCKIWILQLQNWPTYGYFGFSSSLTYTIIIIIIIIHIIIIIIPQVSFRSITMNNLEIVVSKLTKLWLFSLQLYTNLLKCYTQAVQFGRLDTSIIYQLPCPVSPELSTKQIGQSEGNI